jgi:hypothetical protein
MAAVTSIVTLTHEITSVIPAYIDGGSNWILTTGLWVDIGVWEDTAVWID